MVKYGYVLDRDYRIKLISQNKDKTIFGMLAKTIKSGGIRQDNGWYLNPIEVSPTNIEGLYYLNENRVLLYHKGFIYTGSKVQVESDKEIKQ